MRDQAGDDRGARYGAYFFELDAWSEYWDLYHPETGGRYHFGDGSSPGCLSVFLPDPERGRSPVFDAWKAYAYASRDADDEKPRRLFEEQARRPEVAAAVIEVDDLVRSIFVDHFGDAAAAEAYFDAIERFALDRLPPCPERAARLAPDDPRSPFAGTHRMAGDIMWFAWATELECAQVAGVTDAEAEAIRTLLLAGVAVGCSIDYRFTGRCRTPRAYDAPDDIARARILRRGFECSGDFAAAAAEVRDLFFVRRYGDE
jgi:hypothetical protein